MKLMFSILLLSILLSCSIEPKSIEETPKPPKKEFLNHEILNDSIHYKIKEYDKSNHILRNICVFNKEKLIDEQLIYKVQKKELLDEGYFKTSKKEYRVLKPNVIELKDLAFHYFDYNVESIDTVIQKLIVTPSGEIEIEKP